jgi:hypothetical protein
LSDDGLRLPLQRKLTIGTISDPLESEADTMTDRVMRGQHAPSAACEDSREPSAVTSIEAPPIVHEVLRSPGQPLDSRTRTFFESRFGWNFSNVRVHADEESAASAEAVGARAYTVGHHMAFGTGQFAPHLDIGRRLLAHELTHVIQQSNRQWHGARVPEGEGDADGIHEQRHGDSGAERVVAGHRDAALLPSGGGAKAGMGFGESRTLQRAPGQVPPEKVQEVYGSWAQEFLRARKTTILTEELDKKVRERVKQQVGPGNFARWEGWERSQRAKEDAQVAADNAPSKPLNLQTQLQGRRDQLWAATEQLRVEIVRLEYLAQKLNFGRGAKGATARATAGGYTALYGVGARTVGSVAEHAPMLVLGAGGLLLGSELAERTLIKQGRAVKQEGEEMGQDVHTAVKLVGGELQAAYEATRPAYNKYQKAYSEFGDASTKFNKDLDLEGSDGAIAQAKDVVKMEAAMRAMREAGSEYLMACAKMGIETNSEALDQLASHIVQGTHEAVGTAVTMGLPEVAPGLGEIRSAVKGAKGMGPKQLEKAAADEFAAIAKTGKDAAGKGTARSAALKATEEAALKPGMAPKAGPPATGARAEVPGAGASKIEPPAADRSAIATPGKGISTGVTHSPADLKGITKEELQRLDIASAATTGPKDLNCAGDALALDAHLAGEGYGEGVAQWNEGLGAPAKSNVDDLGIKYDEPVWDANFGEGESVQSVAEMSALVKKWGDGSRGIVRAMNNEGVGHYYNVVNIRGTPVPILGQTAANDSVGFWGTELHMKIWKTGSGPTPKVP